MNNERNFTQTYVNIAEIKDGIVITKDGGMKIVLLCSAINFDLKTEEEQEILIAEYQNFLNSLEFPIQIVVQSRKMDLLPYIHNLEKKLQAMENEILYFHLSNYINFLKTLLKEVNIMDKKFYVIVSYAPPIFTQPSFLGLLGSSQPVKKLSDREFESFKKQLLQRAGVVASGLGNLGIRCVQLSSVELVELFYNVYNPDLSHQEKIRQAKESIEKGTKDG